MVEGTEELLSAVLGAHLVLCRLAILYPWRCPYTRGRRTFLHTELSRLASSLADAWEFLGVSGEARRQMLTRLIVVVGQQTLQARQQVGKYHHQWLQAGFGTAGNVRGAAALRETESKI